MVVIFFIKTENRLTGFIFPFASCPLPSMLYFGCFALRDEVVVIPFPKMLAQFILKLYSILVYLECPLIFKLLYPKPWSVG